MPGTLLIVDDDQSFREVLAFALTQLGYSVDVASDGVAGFALIQEKEYQVVITDIKMPRMDGRELLEKIKHVKPLLPVIVITAFGDIETAVSAMKAGAFDFIPKPYNRAHLAVVLERACDHARLTQEISFLRSRLGSEGKEIIYASASMEECLYKADRLAKTDMTVLISGESGTGKELLARRIARNSGRADKAFVIVNCAAIPRELLESELFGHKKGAFTGALKDSKGKFIQADGGTVFLDEIGELPLELQPRLLRVLQEQTVDVVGGCDPIPVNIRIIAATNRDIELLVKEGKFRLDLFYRLNVLPLTVPPLRERKKDIPLLVSFFLKKYGSTNLTVPSYILSALESYGWPGNVRELENVCQRIAVFAEDGAIPDELLPAEVFNVVPALLKQNNFSLPPGGLSLIELEKQVIEQALQMNDWNKTKTAAFLQIPRHILLYRMEQHGVKKDKDIQKNA